VRDDPSPLLSAQRYQPTTIRSNGQVIECSASARAIPVVMLVILVLVFLLKSATATSASENAGPLSPFERLALLTAKRGHVTNTTSLQCQQHMQLYYDGLQERKTWAYQSNCIFLIYAFFGYSFYDRDLHLLERVWHTAVLRKT